MDRKNSGARGRKGATALNQAVERVQPSPLTDEAVLSPEAAVSTLLALAKRCEAATGPDRELSCTIARATGYDGGPLGSQTSSPWAWCPDYTASIDAALLLVPEDMRDEIEITTLYLVARVTINMNHGPDDGPYYGSNASNSIPLAICAAALKARLNTQVSV